MTQIALATLEALIGLELMALATISKYKATVYKTWSSLAMKWQHLASDTCTENDSQFVFSLPYLPEKVQPDAMFDLDYSFEPVELLLDDGMTIFSLGLCHKMTSTAFVELVRQTVDRREFNFSRNGFNRLLNLPCDIDCVNYWFKKYKTNDWNLDFDDWFFDDWL